MALHSCSTQFEWHGTGSHALPPPVRSTWQKRKIYILWSPCGPGAIGTLRKSHSKSTSWSIISLVPSRSLVLEKKPKKNEVFVVAVPSIGGHSQDPPIRRPGECGKNPPRTKLLFALSSTVCVPIRQVVWLNLTRTRYPIDCDCKDYPPSSCPSRHAPRSK